MDLDSLSFFEAVPYVFLSDTIFWLVRYALFAGAAFVFVYFVARKLFPARRIQKREPGEGRRLKEIGWSVATILMFATMALGIYALKRSDTTLLYMDINEYGWLYYGCSWIALILIHDAYFYWMHRFMHWGPVYRYVHSVHHRSTNPSPLAALAFHPLEALLEFSFMFPLLFVLPMHFSILALYPSLMFLSNVYGHLGYEFLPSGFARSKIGRYLLTSSLHNAHHKKFFVNYGFYFYWWDRWFGTIDPEYENDFRKDADGFRHLNLTLAIGGARGSARPERSGGTEVNSSLPHRARSAEGNALISIN